MRVGTCGDVWGTHGGRVGDVWGGDMWVKCDLIVWDSVDRKLP